MRLSSWLYSASADLFFFCNKENIHSNDVFISNEYATYSVCCSIKDIKTDVKETPSFFLDDKNVLPSERFNLCNKSSWGDFHCVSNISVDDKLLMLIVKSDHAANDVFYECSLPHYKNSTYGQALYSLSALDQASSICVHDIVLLRNKVAALVKGQHAMYIYSQESSLYQPHIWELQFGLAANDAVCCKY